MYGCYGAKDRSRLRSVLLMVTTVRLCVVCGWLAMPTRLAATTDFWLGVCCFEELKQLATSPRRLVTLCTHESKCIYNILYTITENKIFSFSKYNIKMGKADVQFRLICSLILLSVALSYKRTLDCKITFIPVSKMVFVKKRCADPNEIYVQ